MVPPDFTPEEWMPEYERWVVEHFGHTISVEEGEGPEVLGTLLDARGKVSHTLLSFRPVRFGYQRPDRCYLDQENS